MKWHLYFPRPFLSATKKLYDSRKATNRRRSAEQRLKALARQLSSACLRDVVSLKAWEAQRQVYRDRLAWMLGLSPLPARSELQAQVTGVLKRDLYSIEKLVFQSIPGLYVTANFYLPKERTEPLPCVIYLNGHWPSLQGAKTGYQDRYLWYPAHGFALLVVDPIEFGEIPGIHQGTNRLNMWEWLSLGYTPAGVEVWNAMRALDWLETRPEVDVGRIGVTGISGGGVMTQYFGALDERVSVAAPSCSTYTIGNQAFLGLVPEQCDCTFYPNVFGIDFPAVLALIAPRPLIIFGGRKDPTFPPQGFREAFQSAKRIYDLYPPHERGWERIRLVESNEGHTDPPGFLEECHAWMAQWLCDGRQLRIYELDSASPQPEDPHTLVCLTSPPASAVNYHVHEVWIKKPETPLPQNLEEWQQRREQLLDLLKKRVFGWMSTQEGDFKTKRLRHSGGYAGHLSKFTEVELESEPGVWIKVQLLRPRQTADRALMVVWIRGPEDNVNFPDLNEFLPLVQSSFILTVTPRFADSPLSGPVYARIERTAALVGRTIAALQVEDVLAAVRWGLEIKSQKSGPVVIYGRGSSGIVGLYAALLDETLDAVILRYPPTSHRQGPPLLTAMRDTDLHETAALLAPRRLIFLREMEQAFQWTGEVYRLMGAERCLSIQPSLAEAVLSLFCEKRQKETLQ